MIPHEKTFPLIWSETNCLVSLVFTCVGVSATHNREFRRNKLMEAVKEAEIPLLGWQLLIIKITINNERS